MGHLRRAGVGGRASSGTSRDSTSSSSAVAPPTSRHGSPKRGGRVVGVDVNACAARHRTAAAGRDRARLSADRGERARTSRCRMRRSISSISEYGASLWCDPYRWIPEASASSPSRAGDSSSFGGSTLSMLCVPDVGQDRRDSCSGRSSGCTASCWPEGEGAVEFHLGRRRAASTFFARTASRSNGSSSSTRPADAKTHEYYDVRHRRLGAQVAGRGDMGGAQARLTLASTSPQRRAILEQLAIPFDVVAPDVRRRRRRPCN